RTLKVSAWKDVGEVLALEAAKLETLPLEAAKTPGRMPVRLRREGRAQTPEEELKNLLVTLVERPDGKKYFVVREVLAGRAARSLPIGGQVYACVLPGLFCPCDKTIAPPLRNDRYTSAFAVKPG